MITLGDGKDFKNSRYFASYLGLVPKEHSRAEKSDNSVSVNGEMPI
ncbi:transposase [Xenorhabdus miraniensis]|uniref:Transposase n=1 Tax=Xenorhabdus miraniensis TaxID=351674 RepID=A0A2D0JMF4_9GAMM|nr:transposase [Xenorhabdus miraniensis]PHM47440.1 transposase [Xenorhabdus miraniensis]